MNELFNSMSAENFEPSNTFIDETANNRTEYKNATEQLNELLIEGTNLVHELSQPLTFILTSLEIGMMDGGMDRDECKLLLDAVMQMRTQIQMFRQQVRDMSKD
jgi:signal transduction histidine kinase